MANYRISIDLAMFTETKVVTNSEGDRILLVNLDRTPGVVRSAAGKYYLNLIAFKMRERNPYGYTHVLARSISNHEIEAGGTRDYPLVGSLGRFEPMGTGRPIRRMKADVTDAVEGWNGAAYGDKSEKED